MNKHTEAVVAAAHQRDGGDSRSTWALADAVLAAVPDATEKRGFAYDPRAGGVSERLQQLASDLADAGVASPGGTVYSVSSLSNLRDAAMSWPPEQRHAEAAYRTHQEANGERGRAALGALCAIARDEKRVQRPEGLDAEAWDAAKARVRSRTSGWSVAANDIRVALQRQPNVPGRPPKPEPQPEPETLAERVEAEEEADHETVSNVLGTEAAEDMALIRARGEAAKIGQAIRACARHVARIDSTSRAELGVELRELAEELAMVAAQAEGAPDSVPAEWLA